MNCEAYRDALDWLSNDRVPVFILDGEGDLHGGSWAPGPSDRLSLYSDDPDERVAFLTILCIDFRTRHP